MTKPKAPDATRIVRVVRVLRADAYVSPSVESADDSADDFTPRQRVRHRPVPAPAATTAAAPTAKHPPDRKPKHTHGHKQKTLAKPSRLQKRAASPSVVHKGPVKTHKAVASNATPAPAPAPVMPPVEPETPAPTDSSAPADKTPDDDLAMPAAPPVNVREHLLRAVHVPASCTADAADAARRSISSSDGEKLSAEARRLREAVVAARRTRKTSLGLGLGLGLGPGLAGKENGGLTASKPSAGAGQKSAGLAEGKENGPPARGHGDGIGTACGGAAAQNDGGAGDGRPLGGAITAMGRFLDMMQNKQWDKEQK